MVYTNQETLLADVLLSVQSREEMLALLRDLCTEGELALLTQRLQIAAGLREGETYEALRERLGASNTTITRVSSTLCYGSGGYDRVLDRLKERNS